MRFAIHNPTEYSCLEDNSFWLEPTLEVVEKAKVPNKKGARTTPEYRAVHNIARKIRPIMRAELEKGIDLFKKDINLHDLIEALDEGDPSKVMDAVPWDELSGRIEGLAEAHMMGIADSAEKSKAIFRKSIDKLIGVKPDLVFDANNPGIRNWLDQHLGELITVITNDTRKGVIDIIGRAINAGVPPRESAKLIKQIVGLNDRQAKAVINRRIALEKKGIKGRKLDTMVKEYAEKQLKYRSEMIARTEAMNANNRGMFEVAVQNADRGMFDRSQAEKMWIVTPWDRVCKICKPMANKRVPLDGMFRLPNGRVVPHAPAHPNCVCSWSIELPIDSLGVF